MEVPVRRGWRAVLPLQDPKTGAEVEIPADRPRTTWPGHLKLFVLINVKPVSYVSAVGVWWVLPKFKMENGFIQRK